MNEAMLTVVIPAYNEASRIGQTLNKVHSYVTANFRNFEIIVIDDGSTDCTNDVVRKSSLSNIKILSNETNSGKGYSVREGILSSSGNLVLISDADLSTPIEEIEKLLPFIKNEYDIAIGSRGMKDSKVILRQSWYRENMGRAFNLLVRMLLLRGIMDTQCGFKLMKGDAARKLFSMGIIDGFSFDVETLFLAEKANYKIKEVPVRWYNSPQSKVSLLKAPSEMFLDLLRIKIAYLRGRYKI